ncbi:hypothetical protein HaLaN_19166, partial [Haematococcus lacustris]
MTPRSSCHPISRRRPRHWSEWLGPSPPSRRPSQQHPRLHPRSRRPHRRSRWTPTVPLPREVQQNLRALLKMCPWITH